jgi:beta-N-acetylhexosaminidase
MFTVSDDTVDAIGDRALSRSDPETVAILGREMINGAIAGGVLPVIKHIPGHGRAKVDSHLELPRVTDDTKLSSGSCGFSAIQGSCRHLIGHDRTLAL